MLKQQTAGGSPEDSRRCRPFLAVSASPAAARQPAAAAIAALLVLLAGLAGCAQQDAWLANGRKAMRMPATGIGRVPADEADRRMEEAQGPLALARLSERRGQSEQAAHVYRKMIERFPENPLPYHRLAVMQAKAGKWDEAESRFREALERDPDNPDLLADVGYFYYLQSEPEAAEKHLRQALEIEPNHPKSCNNLAILLGEQEHDAECLELFRRAGSEAQACCNMAFVFAQRGEMDRAIEAYSRALSFDDSLRPAAEALVQLAPYAPAQTTISDESSDGPDTGRETSRLVYMIESQKGAGAQADAEVQPASAELAVSSLSDGRAAEKTSPAREPSFTARRSRPDAVHRLSDPSVPATLPAPWKPPMPIMAGANAVPFGQAAGAQLTDGGPSLMPSPPTATGSLSGGR